MEKVLDRNRCMGCSACMNICPVGAISMIRDEEGFLHPEIDQSKCIKCGACKKTCPVINTHENETINECYACYSKDDELKSKSSSGGIFGEVSNLVLENRGIVIGAAFDENNKLKHIAITKKEDLKLLQGSKYLQSDLKNMFKYIKENVNSKLILFVGTPCQVAGLKASLRQEFDNLITMDIICHGVPSPKLFDNYVEYLESHEKEQLVNYNFRDKKTGWDTYSNTATFKSKKKTQYANENDYMKLFLSDNALRKSCYNCNFKLGNKYSDITLGDFWGIKNVKAEMYDKKGVSAVVINTLKGKKMFEEITNNLVYEKCSINDIVKYNPSLKISSKRPIGRDTFFKDLDELSINALVKKYCHVKWINKVKTKIKNQVKKVLK